MTRWPWQTVAAVIFGIVTGYAVWAIHDYGMALLALQAQASTAETARAVTPLVARELGLMPPGANPSLEWAKGRNRNLNPKRGRKLNGN